MKTLRHPLEPLSAEEVQHTVELLKQSDKIVPTTRFVSIVLKELDKTREKAGVMNYPRNT